jgi:hypothetical protein
MFSVRVFRLRDGVAALRYVADGSPEYIRLQPGTVVTVAGESRSSGLIDVMYQGSRFAVFAEDLTARAEAAEAADA